MKSGICPKCQSEEVYVTPQSQEKGSHIFMGWFSSCKLERYVCLSCGLTEEYVVGDDLHDPSKQAKIREHFPKVKG